ncbi:amidohydrolase [Kordiimonas aquimaris]|uniref:amidohydrolase n=1 Tax=Kordiimonas aquimaris TaxID=707591 RepID=UPI0021CF7093|nr:amidohydrolase [Kordiimonas aquimaris]
MTLKQTLLPIMSAIALLLTGCSDDQSSSAPVDISAPDLIVINGDVYTSDPSAARVQAFAITDGKFSAIGSNEQVQALADANTRIINAGGNTVTPGLIDAHSHVSGNSPAVAGVDLSYVADKTEWLYMITEADKRMPEGEWLIGGNWDHTLSDGVYPTKQMLDKIIPDRPAYLTHIDGHYAWVNSKALEMAGVTAETEAPPGGEVVVDAATGDTTGILLEGAQRLVSNIVPDRSDMQRQEGLAKMYKYANSFGITGLHQMGGLEDYLHIIENGDPTMRIWYGTWNRGGINEPIESVVSKIVTKKAEVASRVSATAKEEVTGPLLNLGFVKLINDGVLSAHTAVLTEAYNDREGWKGEYITSPEDLKHQVQVVTAAGLPVAVHSIGDAAVAATLDAFEAAKDNAVPHPNRIEHIEIVHPEDIVRFKDLGIIASMQPNHATNSIVYVPERVGPQRTANAYVWRSMLDAGVPVVFGADYFTSPLSPLIQIADAVFRVSPFGFNDGKPFHPEQAVTFEEALMAYTQAGANITPWKDEIGSITIGKWADFVVLDGKVPTPINVSFRNLAVEATYFAGREVYRKSE